MQKKSLKPELEVLSSSVINNMGMEELSIIAFNERNISDIIFRELKRPNEGFYVDTLCSPVIEYSRCFISKDFIRRGRLYLISQFYSATCEIIMKDPAFLLWAENVYKNIKKNLNKDKNNDYFGCGAILDQSKGLLMKQT